MPYAYEMIIIPVILHRKAVIVGVGYIGIELAGILHTLGSDVTIIARGQKVRAICIGSYLSLNAGR